MKNSNKRGDRDELDTAITRTWWAVICFGLALPIIYLAWFWGFNNVPLSKNDAAPWGAFGDFVGGLLNPFVAFFALYWLNRSIRIQKEELAATKVELAESRIAQQQQVYTLEKQRFEDTFFSLLEQHNSVLEKFSEKVVPDPVFARPNASSINAEICFGQATLFEAKALLQNHDDLCGHYFRILYQLLKLVATRCPGSSLGSEFSAIAITQTKATSDEKIYTNIVRSFLDVDVTQLLAINCFCHEESTYWLYKCLVERYGFLEHMPFAFKGQRYIALEEATDFYDVKAFDKSEFLLDVHL